MVHTHAHTHKHTRTPRRTYLYGNTHMRTGSAYTLLSMHTCMGAGRGSQEESVDPHISWKGLIGNTQLLPDMDVPPFACSCECVTCFVCFVCFV